MKLINTIRLSKAKISAAILISTVSLQVAATPIITNSTGLDNPETVLTFNEEALSINTAVNNQYNGYGVEFSNLFFNPFTSFSGAHLGNFQMNSKTLSFSNIQNSWSIKFDQSYSQAALYMAAMGTGHTLSAYLNGVLVESLSFNIFKWGYYGFENTLFDELRMTTVTGIMLVDTLQYGDQLFTPKLVEKTTSVPEPSTAFLMSIGLIFLFMRRFS